MFNPLAGGYLSGKYRSGDNNGRRATIQFPPVDEAKGEPILSAWGEVAAGHNASMAAAALAWLLQKRSVTSVILGVKHKAQLEDNLKAAHVTLSEADIKKLNDASQLTPEYPGWMMGSSALREHLLNMGELIKQ